MKKSAAASRRHGRGPVSRPVRPKADVVAWIAAVLRQMDHAADLVVAVFRSIGMLGPDEASLAGLPGQFLLELAALLQLREWHAAGVIQWADRDGMSIDDRIGQAIERFRDNPVSVARGRSGAEAMVSVVRRWNESFCPAARTDLSCDIALHWDKSLDVDQIIDVFADFLCRHRDTSHETEVT